jgi:hypothetical protein
MYHYYYYYYYYYSFILTASEFLPGGSGNAIRHNTQHKITYRTQNIAFKTTQTIKDTLHTMNTMQIQL